MHLPSISPRGGGSHGLMWGNMETLWGHCNKFLHLWWGKCGDLASVQLRGDWERSIVHSLDGKMAEERKKVCFKIHCFLSIKQTIRQNLYVFVVISNFKFPLCMYYCLLRSLLKAMNHQNRIWGIQDGKKG